MSNLLKTVQVRIIPAGLIDIASQFSLKTLVNYLKFINEKYNYIIIKVIKLTYILNKIKKYFNYFIFNIS